MIHFALFLVAIIVVGGIFLAGTATAISWCFQLLRFGGIAVGRLIQRPVLLAPVALVLVFVAIQIWAR